MKVHVLKQWLGVLANDTEVCRSAIENCIVTYGELGCSLGNPSIYTTMPSECNTINIMNMVKLLPTEEVPLSDFENLCDVVKDILRTYRTLLSNERVSERDNYEQSELSIMSRFVDNYKSLGYLLDVADESSVDYLTTDDLVGAYLRYLDRDMKTLQDWFGRRGGKDRDGIYVDILKRWFVMSGIKELA